MILTSSIQGWTIISLNHPTSGSSYIVNRIFNRTRKEAIEEFVSDSGYDWKYWRNKYNFRAVRATQTITT